MRALGILFWMMVIPSAQAELSSLAGQTLLESFRCESTNGAAVQNVRNSLSSLKSTLGKIAEQQKECMQDFAAVGKLPEIDSILSQIDSYGSSEDIKKQENIISEALTDLAQLKSIPTWHPDRTLYPDEAILQGMVSQARANLIALRASYSVEQGKYDRRKYLDGVRQLDSLASELSIALQRNSQCFQKNPILRRQVISGLVGISGFFAKSPLGIGLTLAGRVLQNVFDISDSKKINEGQNFESSNQTMLAAGMSCTLENLSTQHCRLIRQSGLLQQLKNPTCKDSDCPPEMKQLQKLVQSGKSATDAVASVTSWLGAKADNPADQALLMKINSDFLSATSSFEASISDAFQKAKLGEASSVPEVQATNQLNSLKSSLRRYTSQLYGPVGGMGYDGGTSSPELNSLFLDPEKKQQALSFLFDDKEYTSLLSETAQEINSSTRLRQKFEVEGVGGIAGRRTPEEASLDVLIGAFGGTEYPDMTQPKKVKDRMKSREAFDRIKARLAQYKARVLERTTVQPDDVQLGNFIMAFQQEELGKPSTLRNLENIQAFFASLPEDYVKTRGALLSIPTLEKEVAEIVTLGKSMESGETVITNENAATLLSKTKKLLDPGRGFKERITNIASSAASYQTQKISRSVKNPNSINDLVFLQNKDFLEQVYDLRNPYEKEVDTKTAIALSASQIDTFGKFVDLYKNPALQVLNGKNIKDVKFSDGLSENMDRSLKDHFCIQALGLTSIPPEIKKECANATIKMGSNELRFDDYVGSLHQDRVCAYRNFIRKVDVKTYQRNSESGNAH